MTSYTSRILPATFIPTEDHIIIGRGRSTKSHSANVKFDAMIATIAINYQAAPSKSQKGRILSQLIKDIHAPSADAGFIKKDPETGRWHSVEESLARTTAAQAIRNFLSGAYRSSKQFKSKRRMQQIQRGMTSPTASASGSASGPASQCISPESSDDESSSCCSQHSNTNTTTTCQHQSDTFALLFSAFGKNTIAASEDPFSPTPLLEQNSSSSNKNYDTTNTSNSLTSLLSSMPMPPVSWDTEPLSLESHSSSGGDSWISSFIESI